MYMHTSDLGVWSSRCIRDRFRTCDSRQSEGHDYACVNRDEPNSYLCSRHQKKKNGFEQKHRVAVEGTKYTFYSDKGMKSKSLKHLTFKEHCVLLEKAIISWVGGTLWRTELAEVFFSVGL